jgi:hypothetical protein
MSGDTEIEMFFFHLAGFVQLYMTGITVQSFLEEIRLSKDLHESKLCEAYRSYIGIIIASYELSVLTKK